MGRLPVYSSPKTEAHLRQILGRLEKDLTIDGGGPISDIDGDMYITKVAGSNITAGQLVYASSATNVDLTNAANLVSAKPIGMAVESVSAGADVRIQVIGIVPMTGLTANTIYFVSAVTPGSLVSTPDATGNQFVTVAGVAISATEFRISPLYPIQL